MGVGDMPAAEPGKHVVRLTASAVDRQSLIRDRVRSEGSVTVDQLVSVLFRTIHCCCEPLTTVPSNWESAMNPPLP